jgi:hypothetical protein
LLDPDQLILVNLGFVFFYFISILDFDLVELGFALVDLWRWWKQVGVEVLVTSVALAGNCYGGDMVACYSWTSGMLSKVGFAASMMVGRVWVDGCWSGGWFWSEV